MLRGKFAHLANLLFELGAIQFGAFEVKLHETRPDAPLSPIYLNLRTPDNPKPGPLSPEALNLAASLMYGLIHVEEFKRFDCLAGIPNAGDPFAAALARNLVAWKVRPIHLVKQEQDGQRRIVGVREDAKSLLGSHEHTPNVLVVDDLITAADTKLEAITALENAGLVVTDLMVLVDREQGGRRQIEDAGYQLHAAFTLTELVEYYAETGRVSRDKAGEVYEYLDANR